MTRDRNDSWILLPETPLPGCSASAHNCFWLFLPTYQICIILISSQGTPLSGLILCSKTTNFLPDSFCFDQVREPLPVWFPFPGPRPRLPSHLFYPGEAPESTFRFPFYRSDTDHNPISLQWAHPQVPQQLASPDKWAFILQKVFCFFVLFETM